MRRMCLSVRLPLNLSKGEWLSKYKVVCASVGEWMHGPAGLCVLVRKKLKAHRRSTKTEEDRCIFASPKASLTRVLSRYISASRVSQ